MGMAASQARYLSLTARKNNNEYEMQQLAQQRAMLAMRTELTAKEYNEKMDNRELLFVQVDPTSLLQKEKKLTYEIITDTNPFSGLCMKIVDANGNTIIPAPIDTEQLRMDAVTAYQEATSNNCFKQVTTESDGTTSSLLLNGENFINSYFSVLDEYKDSTNPILDKDGNEVDIEDFESQIKDLSAPDFYNFWTENQYKFKNNTLETAPGTTTELYAADDSKAKTDYDKELIRISDIENTNYGIDSGCLDPEYLEERLRNGDWLLEKRNTNIGDDRGDWVSTIWQAEPSIADDLDTDDDAAAERKYTRLTSIFQSQDKDLELKMKQLDTEHNALQTEMDSVKKVIEKNIESSFKTFG